MQVSFEREEYVLAKRAAKAQGVSIAEYVRRAVRQTLPTAGERLWMRFAGMVESGDVLRREITIGSDQADRGEFVDGKRTFDEIRKRSFARKRAKR